MRRFALVVFLTAACASEKRSSTATSTNGSSATASSATGNGGSTGGTVPQTDSKPYNAFRAYAAKKLGVTSERMNGGGPIDANSAKATPQTVGNAWAYAYNSAANPGQEANGWAMPDGTVVTSDQNLGLLFEEAGVWASPFVRDAKVLAERLTWSFGMTHRLAPIDPLGRIPAPALDVRPDGSGHLKFVVAIRNLGPGGAGGGPEDLALITVTLTPDHKATLAHAPYEMASAGAGSSAQTTSTGSKDHELIKAHYAKKNWAVTKTIPYQHLPGLYVVHHLGIQSVLVHEGKVVEDKGIAVAAKYAKAIDLRSRTGATADDVIALLTTIGALPDRSNPEDYVHTSNTGLPKLRPVLDLRAGTLVIYYFSLPSGGGAHSNANELMVARYTLSIPPDYKLAWSSKGYWYDKVTHAERPL
jgi:hypothetical protein